MEDSDSGEDDTAEMVVVGGGDGSENGEGRTHGESSSRVTDRYSVGIYNIQHKKKRRSECKWRERR